MDGLTYTDELMDGWMDVWMDEWTSGTVAPPDWFPAWRRPLWLARVSNLTALGRPPRVIHTPMTCVALLPVLCFSLCSGTTIQHPSTTRTLHEDPPLLVTAFYNRSTSILAILSGRPLTANVRLLLILHGPSTCPPFHMRPPSHLLALCSTHLLAELDTSCAVHLVLFEDFHLSQKFVQK